MKLSAKRLIVTVACCACVASQSATPKKERYDIDLTCAGLIGAAVEFPSSTSATTPDQTRSLLKYYMQRADASGREAGLAPTTIARDIQTTQARVVAALRTPDATQAQTERADNENMIKKCAALPVFEAMDGKPSSAPAPR